MSQSNHRKVVELSELTTEKQELCNSSLEARMSSYSPYSQFKVGAALLTKQGEIISGCNVENASYGLAICAERTACVKAVSQGFHEFTSIAITADLGQDFCGPCGACRQFLCEFNPTIEVLLVRPVDNQVQITNLGYLFPESFSPKTLNLEFHNPMPLKK